MTAYKQAINTLIELLEHGNEVDRCSASQTLGALKAKEASSVLTALLVDEDLDVCVDAALALGEIGETNAVEGLLATLMHDPEGEVKTAVTKALATIGGKNVISSLIQLVEQRPEDMEDTNDDDWDDWWDIQLHAVEALGKLNATEAVSALSAMLNDEDNQDIESETVAALAKLGNDGAAIVCRRLLQGQARERRRAAAALAHSNSSLAKPNLFKALSDRDADVRENALRSLGKLDAKEYIYDALGLLKDSATNVRLAAIDVSNHLAVVNKGKELQIEKLTELINDNDSGIRAAVLELIERQLKNDPSLDQRITGDETLYLQILASAQSNTQREASAALAILALYQDRNALELLLKNLQLEELDEQFRRDCTLSLANFSDHANDLLPLLFERVSDDSQVIRLAALTALKQLAQQQPLLADDMPSPLKLITASLHKHLPDFPQAPEQGSTSEAENKTPEKNEVMDEEKDEESSSPVQIIETTDITEALEEKEPFDEEAALEEILGKYSTPYSDEENNKEDEAAPTEQEVLSTLDALNLENVETALLQDQQTKATTLEEMINELPEEMDEFAGVIKENIATADKLFTSKKPLNIKEDARLLSARILASIPCAESISALTTVLDNTDETELSEALQQEAIDALGKIAQAEPTLSELDSILPYAIDGLQSQEGDIRRVSAATLGYLPANQNCITQLINALTDDNTYVRIAAINGLQHQYQRVPEKLFDVVDRSQLEQLLRALLSDPEYGVRRAATDTLSSAGLIDSLDIITTTALADGGVLARDIGKMLCRFDKNESIHHLTERLKNSEDYADRRSLMQMLEEVCKQPAEQNREAA